MVAIPDIAQAAPTERRRSIRLDVANAAVMAVLVLGIVAGNYVVDPYRLNRAFELDLHKEESAARLSYQHWRLAAFMHDPTPVVLIGDSRMAAMPADVVEAATGERVQNLGMGGANIREFIDTFWFVTKNDPGLQRVIMGVNLTNLSEGDQTHQVRDALDLMGSPLRYYLSAVVTKATIQVLAHHLMGTQVGSEAPPMTPDAFWEFQLRSAERRYRGFRFAAEELDELLDIGTYCREHSITLDLVVFPVHTDLQRMVAELGLEEQRAKLLTGLAAAGTVHDYEVDDAVTRDPANFKDPYHAVLPVMERVAREVGRRAPGEGGPPPAVRR